MKNTYSIIIVCLILCSINLTKAQKEIPIEISPLIGEKLDRVERDYFGFLPRIEGFQEAVFYLNQDSSLQVNIRFEEEGILKDTVITKYKSLIRVQNQIHQILTYYLNDVQPDERGEFAICNIIDSSKINGELLSAEENHIMILSMTEKSYEDEINPFKVKNPAGVQNPTNVRSLYENEIDNIYLKEKSRFWSIIYPIIGGAVGAIIGYNIAENHKIKNPGLFQESAENFSGMLLGELVGMIASVPFVLFLPIETTSETIIETPFNGRIKRQIAIQR